MTTVFLTHAKAHVTAAKPPSTTKTMARPGNQWRACFIICHTPSTLVFCRRRPGAFLGQQRAVKTDRAHTRWLQGTGTKRIIETHVSPKQRMTCVCEDRTAS